MQFFSHGSRFILLCGMVLLPMVGDASGIDRRPVCDATGTKSEGWYQSSIRVTFAPCRGCLAFCGAIGTDQEGWYNWCDGSVVTAEPCAAYLPTFVDVPARHPLHSAVTHAASLGLAEGYPSLRGGGELREYRPRQFINRAEFVKMLMAAMADADTMRLCTDRPFTDVDGPAWYAPFLCVAFRQGIVTGYPDGTFRPDQSLNFAEAAMIITRALRLPAPPVTTQDPWYRGPVEALESQRAIPMTVAAFAAPLTRGEMAEILLRIHVPNAQHDTLTYEQLAERLRQSASSSPATLSPTLRRVTHESGHFSLQLPVSWLAQYADGAHDSYAALSDDIRSFGVTPDATAMTFAVLHGTDPQRHAKESLVDYVRRTVLAPFPPDAIVAMDEGGSPLLHVRSPDLMQAFTYHAVHIQGEHAVVLGFPAEDALATEIVSSLRWQKASSSFAGSAAIGPPLPPPRISSASSASFVRSSASAF